MGRRVREAVRACATARAAAPRAVLPIIPPRPACVKARHGCQRPARLRVMTVQPAVGRASSRERRISVLLRRAAAERRPRRPAQRPIGFKSFQGGDTNRFACILRDSRRGRAHQHIARMVNNCCARRAVPCRSLHPPLSSLSPAHQRQSHHGCRNHRAANVLRHPRMGCGHRGTTHRHGARPCRWSRGAASEHCRQPESLPGKYVRKDSSGDG